MGKNVYALNSKKKVKDRKHPHAEVKKLDPTLAEEINQFYPTLREIAEWVRDNQRMVGFRALCYQVFPCGGDKAKRDEKYRSVKILVDKELRKGKDFRHLLVKIVDDLNIMQISQITQMLFEKAIEEQDTKAAELYLKATGKLGAPRTKKEVTTSSLQPVNTPDFVSLEEKTGTS